MTGRSARIVGVDVARYVALVGMVATHILPGVVDGEVTVVQQVAGGRASALFAVLAGVSLVLAAGRRTPLHGRRYAGFLAGVLVRALLIGLVGLGLGEVDAGIAVILTYYAVIFLVAAPFLAMPTRLLVATTLLWVGAAPVVSLLLRRDLPPSSYGVPSFESLATADERITLVRELLLTGYYPAITWVGYVLAGILVARMDLRAPRTPYWLLGLGIVASASAWAASSYALGLPGVRRELRDTFTGAGWLDGLDATLQHGLYGVTPTDSWWWLAVRAPHSGTTPDLVLTAGSAVAVLGLSLLLVRLAPRVAPILFGAGAIPLTLYSLHVLSRREGWWDGEDLTTLLGQLCVLTVIGAAFAVAGRRGPLEWGVSLLSGAARRVVGGRP